MQKQIVNICQLNKNIGTANCVVPELPAFTVAKENKVTQSQAPQTHVPTLPPFFTPFNPLQSQAFKCHLRINKTNPITNLLAKPANNISLTGLLLIISSEQGQISYLPSQNQVKQKKVMSTMSSSKAQKRGKIRSLTVKTRGKISSRAQNQSKIRSKEGQNLIMV